MIADEFSSENWNAKHVEWIASTGATRGPPLVLPQAPRFACYVDDGWTSSGSMDDAWPKGADGKATSTSSSATLTTIPEPYSAASSARTSISSVPPHSRPPTRRTKSCSSTIPIHIPSSTVPIFIMLTTPEDEGLSCPNLSLRPSSYPHARASIRSSSSPSMPSAPFRPRKRHAHGSSGSVPGIPDLSLLMPPSEHALDGQRLRQAQEAQEARDARRFIITFLSTKGDTFPRKLRARIMEGYAIDERELPPDVLRRFHAADAEAGRDEGVALHASRPSEDDQESLRILEMALRSSSPSGGPLPAPWQRARRATAAPTPARAGVPAPVAPRRRPSSFHDDVDVGLAREREKTARQRMCAAAGADGVAASGSPVPPPVPVPVPVAPPGKRPSVATLTRQSLVSGALDAVREAMGGLSAATSGRRREWKRRMTLDGR